MASIAGVNRHPHVPKAAVGSRVNVQQAGGSKVAGTVKYVGQTEFGNKGEWVGVELDQASGKNDGSVGGVGYFNCAPNKGLFVRPESLHVLPSVEEFEDVNKRAQGLNVNDIGAKINNVKNGGEYVVLENKMTDYEHKIEVVEQMFWFKTQARCFSFNKSTKSWIELGCGWAQFHWSGEHEKIRVSLECDASKRKCLDHLVDLSTKLEPTLAAQQSWVFRGARSIELSVKDVLCLQFASVDLARGFVSSFEQHRARVALEQVDASMQESGPAKKNRLEPEKKTRVMRRRLTVSGSDPNLDGHELGAGIQKDSPRPSSPKTLRAGLVGEWKSNVGEDCIRVAAYSGVSRKGVAPYNPDKQNQDAIVMQELPVNGYCNGELLLCVFDGHGAEGHLVSRHLAARIARVLASAPDFGRDEHTPRVLADALLTCEKELIDDPKVDTTLSGTTAVVCVLRGSKFFVANVGDSRVIKGAKSSEGDKNGSKRIVAADLSIDHKPDDPRERERIVKQGGRVFAMRYDDGIDGPARVWLSYADMPGLAMSRSVCDTIGKEAGVSSNAETHVHNLAKGKDRFIVLATDGLWEFMSSQEVTDIVSKYADTLDPRGAINELVRESNRRWQLEEPVVDDTSIIVLYLE